MNARRGAAGLFRAATITWSCTGFANAAMSAGLHLSRLCNKHIVPRREMSASIRGPGAGKRCSRRRDSSEAYGGCNPPAPSRQVERHLAVPVPKLEPRLPGGVQAEDDPLGSGGVKHAELGLVLSVQAEPRPDLAVR